jgi:hypothetical protein
MYRYWRVEVKPLPWDTEPRQHIIIEAQTERDAARAFPRASVIKVERYSGFKTSPASRPPPTPPKRWRSRARRSPAGSRRAV